MKIVITGATGDLGVHFVEYLSKQDHLILPISRGREDKFIQMDLLRKEVVSNFLDQTDPDIIIHLAAIKDIFFCESHPQDSYMSNFEITKTIVEHCAKSKAQLVYFSTDYVFGNSENEWFENSTSCATTKYGKDKEKSEQLISYELKDYSIIRTAQVYGFDGDLVSTIYKSLSNQHSISVFSNLINCPTYIHDLLRMVGQIIRKKLTGIFHCVGPQPLSRLEFATQIAQIFDLNTKYLMPEQLDFSVDIRPSMVKLNGESTYQRLDYQPKPVKDNLTNVKHLYTLTT